LRANLRAPRLVRMVGLPDVLSGGHSTPNDSASLIVASCVSSRPDAAAAAPRAVAICGGNRSVIRRGGCFLMDSFQGANLPVRTCGGLAARVLFNSVNRHTAVDNWMRVFSPHANIEPVSINHQDLTTKFSGKFLSLGNRGRAVDLRCLNTVVRPCIAHVRPVFTDQLGSLCAPFMLARKRQQLATVPTLAADMVESRHRSSLFWFRLALVARPCPDFTYRRRLVKRFSGKRTKAREGREGEPGK